VKEHQNPRRLESAEVGAALGAYSRCLAPNEMQMVDDLQVVASDWQKPETASTMVKAEIAAKMVQGMFLLQLNRMNQVLSGELEEEVVGVVLLWAKVL